MVFFRRISRALTRSRALTEPGDPDPRLRGRTYAIPFDRVWREALELAQVLPRWTVVRADDQAGVMEAEARSVVFRFVDDVRVGIGLDQNGQTRVDVESRSRRGLADLGVNARRIDRYLRKLDQALKVRPQEVLDPRVDLDWEEPAR